MIINSIFNKTVTVNTDAEFVNCEFKVAGVNKKDQNTPGIRVTGDANITVKNSKFTNKGYEAIHVTTSGKVVLDGNVFECDNIYNPIECTVGEGSPISNVTIKNNVFNGICGNNYINFYKVADDAVINIINNIVTGASRNSEIVRLSNPLNRYATFNISNMNYTYTDGDVNDYTAFIMCQDYTAKNGVPQEFNRYTINIKDLVCDGVSVNSADEVPDGSLCFTYQDGAGIIDSNNPVINFM